MLIMQWAADVPPARHRPDPEPALSLPRLLMDRLLLALFVASLAIDVVTAQGTAPAGTKPPVPLENTPWKLVAVGNVPAIALPAAREASFMLHPGDHRLSDDTSRYLFQE